MSYNGYTNYATWNVALWFDNEYDQYLLMLDYVSNNHWFDHCSYRDMIHALALEDMSTPDGIAYLDSDLDYDELDAWLLEHVDCL